MCCLGFSVKIRFLSSWCRCPSLVYWSTPRLSSCPLTSGTHGRALNHLSLYLEERCAVAVASPRNDTHTVTPDYPEVESACADQPDGLSEQVALASLEIASRLCDVQVAGSHRVSHGGNDESSMVVTIMKSHRDFPHFEQFEQKLSALDI